MCETRHSKGEFQQFHTVAGRWRHRGDWTKSARCRRHCSDDRRHLRDESRRALVSQSDELSDCAEVGLEALPGAITVAIVAPELAGGGPPEWTAAALAAAVAWKTDNPSFRWR